MEAATALTQHSSVASIAPGVASDGSPNSPTVRVYSNRELTNEQYHAERDHISSSQLVHVLRTPAHFRFHLGEGASEESDLMRLGTAVHCNLLEPESFPQRYVYAPRSYDRRLKADTQEIALLEAQYAGRTLVSPKEAATLERVVRGISQHALAQELLTAQGESELSIFWRDDLTGLPLKVRIDRYVKTSTGLMVEIKTTENASAKAFASKIAELDYDLRAVMYADGIRTAFGFTPAIRWVVIERETGLVAVYHPTPAMLQRGRDRYEQARIALKHALTFNRWPAYQSGEASEPIDPPRWARH